MCTTVSTVSVSPQKGAEVGGGSSGTICGPFLPPYTLGPVSRLACHGVWGRLRLYFASDHLALREVVVSRNEAVIVTVVEGR